MNEETKTLKLRILLVEDNPDDGDLLREALRDSGVESQLVVAETLRAARQRLKDSTYDLILLDLSLPDSTGLETVKRVAGLAPDVPIVVLTGLSDRSLAVAAVHAGAQDYLVKGYTDPPMLERCIHYAIERQRLLAAQTENVLVWRALARAGEALLQTSNAKTLADRLCEVAVGELECAVAETWVVDDAAQVLLPVAARPPAAWRRLSEQEVSLADLGFASAGGAEESVRWLSSEGAANVPALLLPAHDLHDVLYLVLARGGEVIGLQVCGFVRSPAKTVKRIARGLVHLATLALSNARLVDQLEQSNTIKTYFAGTMSHEVRSTLFAIGGYGEILADHLESQNDADAMRFARQISERAQELARVVQAALELTRSEVLPAQPDAGEVAIDGLVEQVASEIFLPAGKTDLEIVWEIPVLPQPLRTDPVKLKMILKNLVANAIKFTEQGSVRIVGEATEETLCIAVVDTGIGIPVDELPHIFEPFRQVHGQGSRRAGGVGLGLYIVKRLGQLLGGDVAVSSAPGQGSTFTLTLPWSPPLPGPGGRQRAANGGL